MPLRDQYQQALSLRDDKKFDAAIRALREILSSNELQQSEPSVKHNIYYAIAEIYEHGKNDTRQAISYYQMAYSALAETPEMPLAQPRKLHSYDGENKKFLRLYQECEKLAGAANLDATIIQKIISELNELSQTLNSNPKADDCYFLFLSLYHLNNNAAIKEKIQVGSSSVTLAIWCERFLSCAVELNHPDACFYGSRTLKTLSEATQLRLAKRAADHQFNAQTTSGDYDLLYYRQAPEFKPIMMTESPIPPSSANISAMLTMMATWDARQTTVNGLTGKTTVIAGKTAKFPQFHEKTAGNTLDRSVSADSASTLSPTAAAFLAARERRRSQQLQQPAAQSQQPLPASAAPAQPPLLQEPEQREEEQPQPPQSLNELTLPILLIPQPPEGHIDYNDPDYATLVNSNQCVLYEIAKKLDQMINYARDQRWENQAANDTERQKRINIIKEAYKLISNTDTPISETLSQLHQYLGKIVLRQNFGRNVPLMQTYADWWPFPQESVEAIIAEQTTGSTIFAKGSWRAEPRFFIPQKERSFERFLAEMFKLAWASPALQEKITLSANELRS